MRELYDTYTFISLFYGGSVQWEVRRCDAERGTCGKRLGLEKQFAVKK
jgi:hypothetical protein